MNEQLKHLTVAVWALVFVTLGSTIATCASADGVKSAIHTNSFVMDRMAEHLGRISGAMRSKESLPVRIVGWPWQSTLHVYETSIP